MNPSFSNFFMKKLTPFLRFAHWPAECRNTWNTCKRAQTLGFLTLMMLLQTDRGRQGPLLKAGLRNAPSLLAVPTLKSLRSLGGLSHALYTSLHQFPFTGSRPCGTGDNLGRPWTERRRRSGPSL